VHTTFGFLRLTALFVFGYDKAILLQQWLITKIY